MMELNYIIACVFFAGELLKSDCQYILDLWISCSSRELIYLRRVLQLLELLGLFLMFLTFLYSLFRTFLMWFSFSTFPGTKFVTNGHFTLIFGCAKL